MSLFFAAFWKDSVSLIKFTFLKVFSCEILSVYHLKYPYSCFSSRFRFLVIVFSLYIVCDVIGRCDKSFLFFLTYSSSLYINASTQSSILVSPLPPSFLHIIYRYNFAGVTTCASTSTFLSLFHLSEFFPGLF